MTGDGLALFLHRGDNCDQPGTWCFPGGSVEAGETADQAARREAMEETGYSGDVPLQLGHSAVDDYGFQFDTFVARIPEPFEVRLNGEHTEYQWAALDNPPEPLHPGVRLSLTMLSQKVTFADEPVQSQIVAKGNVRLEELLKTAMARGRDALASVVESALQRYLREGPKAIRKNLFNEDERATFTNAMEEACTMAELLGRSRLVRYAEQIDANSRGVGKVHFSANTLDTFAEPPPPMASRRALEYFQRLIPKLGLDPQRYGPLMERHAFTMAAASEETLLERVKNSLQDYLGTDWLSPPRGAKAGAQVVQSVLDQAGLSPSNPQYADMVFRTNVLDSYHSGFDRQMAEPEMQDKFPAWEYLGISDGREGGDHKPKFGKIYPSSATFAEVRGERLFNCRCNRRPLHRSELEDLLAKGARVETSW